MKKICLIFICVMSLLTCNKEKHVEETSKKTSFVWEGATVYFLLTDRFNNGDPSNDLNFNRTKETAKLRSFKGGDLRGVTQKIKEGYFTDLGINAIWMTPIVEQIHDMVDEGTGGTYGFHGYWTKDWTTLDPNFGTEEDLKELVETAHKKGIRILLDAVINHTGPVTDVDTKWPDNWVRTEPQCTYESYDSTVTCTLVKNLPDIKTESNDIVNLPPQLVEKWKAEGRYDQEVKELDAFFKSTGHPKAPRFYIMKWLADYILDYGIDGYRVDTVKHTEEFVWQEFRAVCDASFKQWKSNNTNQVLDDTNFYLVGEVYNYSINAGRAFDFGDKNVDYFDKSFNALINFDLKYSVAQHDLETVFSRYSDTLNTNLKGYSVMNYMSSHDDGQPFDPDRQKPFETATALLLAPGASQIYYGDESARSLVIDGTNGDATLRSFMNWDAIENDVRTQDVLAHWQKLGQFRASHPAVGAGIHSMISKKPYLFSRLYKDDKVVVGLALPSGTKELIVSSVFDEGDRLRDAYSGEESTVENGKIVFTSDAQIVLLEKM